MIIALDTEVAGLEIRQGCSPFLIQTWVDEDPSDDFLSFLPEKPRDDHRLLPGLSTAPVGEIVKSVQLPRYQGTPTPLEGHGYNWALTYDPLTRNTSMAPSKKRALSLLLTGATVVFHNAFFDMMALARAGIYLDFPDHPAPFCTTDLYYLSPCKHFPDPLAGSSIVIKCKDFHDTMLACHVYDSKGPRALKDAGIHYLLISDSDEEQLLHITKIARQYCKRHHKDWKLGKDLKGNGQTKYDYALSLALYRYYLDNPLPEGRDTPPLTPSQTLAPVVYGSIDSYRTLALHYVLAGLLDDEGRSKHYEDQRAQLTPCFSMQCCGVSLSQQLAPLRKELSKGIFARKREIRRQIRDVAPKLFTKEPFNPNSHKQLGHLLFSREGFGLTPIKYTDSGEPSTASAVRKELAAKALLSKQPKQRKLYEFLQLITSWDDDDPNHTFPEANTGYDAWKKSVGYLDSYLRHAIRGVVFPSYNATGTDTTRYSSSNPNGQNIGKKDRVPLRMAFGPTGEYTWYAIDYSQLELRLFAAACQDQTLLSAFTEGRDYHALVASNLFNISQDEVTSQRRLAAKCFHPNTEVLTKTGWKKITELMEGEEIAQANPSTHAKVELSWVVPTNVFKKKNNCKRLVHLKNEGIDLRVTPDHRMLYWGSGKKGEYKVGTPYDMEKARYWANAGILNGGENKDEDFLRLCVAVQADGSYSYDQIRFGFTKERKIIRLRNLLEKMCIPYAESTHKNGKNPDVTAFSLSGEIVSQIKKELDKKLLPWKWLNLSVENREIVLEELEYWDSHKAEKWRMYKYSSSVRQNLDVAQALATVTGRKTRLSNNDLTLRDTEKTRGGNLNTIEEEYTGDVVCLSVPDGFIVVRDRGVPVIVGQCINFGLIYGAGRHKIETLAGFKGAYDKYCVNFPSAADYMKRTIAFAEKNGYVETLYGYPLHLGQDPSYKGVNYVVQGTAGQIVKYAMLALNDTLDWKHVKIILNVHDELIFAIHNSYDETAQHKIISNIATVMEQQGDRIGVHTPVDCGIIKTHWKGKESYALST